MDYSLRVVDAPLWARSLLSPMAFGLPILIGFAIFVTSCADIFRFAKENLRQSYTSDQESKDGI